MTKPKIHDSSQAAERKQIIAQFVEDEKNQAKLSKPAALLLAERLRQAKERLEKGK